MKLDEPITYTQLKTGLANLLGKPTVPPATLSLWMQKLGYPKGQPGQKREWAMEDLCFIGAYVCALRSGKVGKSAVQYAVQQLETLESHYKETTICL